MSLSLDDKKTLLLLARASIRYGLDHATRPPDTLIHTFKPLSDHLKKPSAAFVTLKKHSALRGCIGTIQPTHPLAVTVKNMAYAAAFEDPRFPPVEEQEFHHIALEISVLSPLVPVEAIEDIEIGRDGLLVERAPFRGLLLPQVAMEYQWDRETFLDYTCRKAGLPPHAWKEKDCKIYRFTAEVWDEKILSPS